MSRPRSFAPLITITAVLLVSGTAVPASAQQGKLLGQQLDAAGQGYSVLRVWGTAHEMGYAQGHAFAKEIASAVEQFKQLRSAELYAVVRLGVEGAIWTADDAAEELEGIVAGVKAALPDATLDVGDLKVVNTYGDWGYAYACRSHSTWGSFVEAPVKTLSTRRLDFGSPVDAIKHHLLVARQPQDGVRWVSLQWPGLALAVTGVNEHGTLASLHDYRSQATPGPHLPRSSLVRIALTAVDGLPPAQHLDAVQRALEGYTITTGTFLNYYVPEGLGGVLTCDSGGKCAKKRVPQADFFGGEVLMTTNTETDGHSAPSDDSLMEAYYQKGGKKTIDDHHGLMGHGGLHLLSVAYRGRGDMSLWFEGRVSAGTTPTVKLEWSSLFQGAPPPVQPPAGEPTTDGGGPTPQPATDSGRDAGEGEGGDEDEGGCSVGENLATSLPLGGLLLLGLLLGLSALGRRRSGPTP